METNGLSSMAASLSQPGTGGLGLAQGDGTGLAALFGGTSFTMPFGASGAPQQSTTGTQLASWGGGEYHHLGEPGASALDWKGNMVSAHAGVDVRVGPDILAGVAGSYSSGGFDFTDKTGASPVRGTYGATMTGVHPYLAWFSGARGTSVVGARPVSAGARKSRSTDVREGLRTSPASMLTGAGRRRLPVTRQRRARGIRIKGRGLGTAGSRSTAARRLRRVTLAMQRGRLALELTQGFRTDTGHELAVVLEGRDALRQRRRRERRRRGSRGRAPLHETPALGVDRGGAAAASSSLRAKATRSGGFGGHAHARPGGPGRGGSRSGWHLRTATTGAGWDQLWEPRGSPTRWAATARARAPAWTAKWPTASPASRGTPYGGFPSRRERGARPSQAAVRYDLGAGRRAAP